MKIRIGTRGSVLALKQVEIFQQLIHDVDTEIVILQSKGDLYKDQPLSKIGGKGLFVGTFEEALKDNKIDIAIHSGKDLPSISEDCFDFITLKREEPQDVLLSIKPLSTTPVIGTASPRRALLIQKRYPHCQIKLLRGNIDTRLKKLLNNEYDGIILAKAGLNRLKIDLNQFRVEELPTDSFIPAACQGIIACEYLKESPYASYFKQFDHQETHHLFNIERQGMAMLKASCHDAAAIYARYDHNQLLISGFYKESHIYHHHDLNQLIKDIENE